MISKKRLAEFKAIYKKQYGKDISDQEALESATALLNMMRAIYKPITKAEYKAVQKRRTKTLSNNYQRGKKSSLSK